MTAALTALAYLGPVAFFAGFIFDTRHPGLILGRKNHDPSAH